MKFISYGDEKLSKLSLGTVQFGLDYGIANTDGQPSQETVNKIIDYISAEGLNCLDTAQAYGSAETVLGKAIRNRTDFFVISKLKSAPFEADALSNVNASLDNLGIDSLYAILLHDSELLYRWNDTHTKIVDLLKERKKIRYFGVSIYTSEDFDLALENESIQFIQIPFNIFDQRAITEGWFEKAKAKDKLIFIRSVFLQGLLLLEPAKVPSTLKQAQEPLQKYAELCEKLGISRQELALSFVDNQAENALILFGCDTLEQAQENISVFKNLKELDNNTLDYIISSFSKITEDIYNPANWK